MRAIVAVCLVFSCGSAWSQTSKPTLSGYITRVASRTDFDINGVRVLCGSGTSVIGVSVAGCPAKAPVVGQAADVWGHRKKTPQAIAADNIDIKPVERDDISGYAVIDAVAGPSGFVPGAVEVRADGYRMLLTPQTEVTFEVPLRGTQDVMPNVWVEYEAKARPDGLFILKNAKFSQNFVTSRENAMRARTDYDPSAVPANADPRTVAVTVGLGVDPKRIPPWPNREEQDRIDAIGRKLVPEWESNLAASDPSRIDFRFQLTNGKRWPWVLALPSGIILVPHEMVERTQNDSQLAEILADAIACVLEKQTYRMRIADTVVAVGSVASWASFVPVVGVPAQLAGAGTGAAKAVKVAREQHQSGRVSLSLMHDAGYDVTQAPIAWWLLASKKSKPLDRVAMPDRAAYLYRVLGEMWGGQS